MTATECIVLQAAPSCIVGLKFTEQAYIYIYIYIYIYTRLRPRPPDQGVQKPPLDRPKPTPSGRCP